MTAQRLVALTLSALTSVNNEVVKPGNGHHESLLSVSSIPQPTADQPGSSSRPGRRLIVWMVTLMITVTLADQLSKYWAESVLADRESIAVIGELIQFRLLYNSGAAFSIATGMTWLLTGIVGIVIIVVVRASTRMSSRVWAIAFGLLLGGALGNLIDRIAREPGFPEGHVVDFIDYSGLFVGNVADIAIVAAAVLIAVLTLRGVSLDGKPPQRRSRHPAKE